MLKQMKIRKVLLIFILILVALLLDCSKIIEEPFSSKFEFAIYFLQDSTIKIRDIVTDELVKQDSKALNNIVLQKKPWLTNNDIEMYDFSSHILYLKSNKYNFLPEPIKLDVPSLWYYRPFMVVTNGVRRYVGSFRGFVDEGKILPFPVIDCSNNYLYPEDLLIISWQIFDHEDIDSRNDESIKATLSKNNILHEGLELKLKNLRFLSNSDTATIEYTFTLRNNDVDNLYILDPDKIGSDLFHYYNIGPQFIRDGEPYVRVSSLHKPYSEIPSNAWNNNWYVKINSNDSITRTVSLSGYPHFPTGYYTCEITYQSIKKISKEQRILSDGRYWIGPIKSKTVAFEFNDRI
jgi:hypothetical protein